MADLRKQLLEDGYVIIRDTVPPARLDELRSVMETLVERQYERWRGAPHPDQQVPAYYERQPRLLFQTVVDADTTGPVDFCLHDDTLGVSRGLMGAPDAAPTLMALMCNPQRDHGPDAWHRDLNPRRDGPLRLLQQDTLTNGPGYVQWNVPLYDDAVLWVVPRSHRRTNTAEENRILSDDPHVPLPGGIPVELAAGDGVVYLNGILHWGSNYSTKLRRTIHLGYRSFGGALFPHANGFNWDMGFTRHLASEPRARFERFWRLHAEERKLIASIFRAIVAGDARQFRARLAALHAGAEARIEALILIRRIAQRLDWQDGQKSRGFDLMLDIADSLSPAEGELLLRRFEPLDAALRTESEQFVPGFQSGPSEYAFNQMTREFDIEDFIASWDRSDS